MATTPWVRVLAFALAIVGMAMFFINAEAVVNGDAVECDGSPMRPGQSCVSFSGGETLSYDEEKKSEARGEVVGYAGVGLGALGIVLFIGHGIPASLGPKATQNRGSKTGTEQGRGPPLRGSGGPTSSMVPQYVF